MTKKYKASTVVSFPIYFEDGSYKRINFLPFSYGGSIFTTSEKRIQDAIERLPTFGKQILLEDSYGEVEPEVQEPEVEETTAPAETVNVNDLEEARDYLVETYGASRAKLRSKASIVKCAAENGIVFSGI